MRFLTIATLLLAMLSPGAHAQGAQPAPPTPEQIESARTIVTANTLPIAFDNAVLAGKGADLILERTKNSQFILLGEAHNDRDTPLFSQALMALFQPRGFKYLVVELDPLAVHSIVSKERRGRAEHIAELARKYPTHIGFASDQDIELYAFASRASGEGDPTVWGIEQAQGADRYLEELSALAPSATIRRQVEALLAGAREERTEFGAFMHDDVTTLDRLKALQTAFAPPAGSRSHYLLDMLTRSTEIYSFNRRANSGEPVGLYNNTAREALFKEHFLTNYRRAARGGEPLPKVVFKMGANHMYRGKSPVQAYTIGNFAHEFAIANGHDAYGINIVPVGGYAAALENLPKWLRPILPARLPNQPILIDLDALKPHARKFTAQLDAADQWQLRDYIHGHNALVLLPNSAKASWKLTGFPQP